MQQDVHEPEVRTCPRRYQRLEVNWDAQCVGSDVVLKGRILDVSPDGLFFVPEGGQVGKARLENYPVPQMLRPGESVHVELPTGTRFDTQVRWVGQSRRHGAEGFGLEVHNTPDSTSSVSQNALMQLWRVRDAMSLLALRMVVGQKHHELARSGMALERFASALDRLADGLLLAESAEQLLREE